MEINSEIFSISPIHYYTMRGGIKAILDGRTDFGLELCFKLHACMGLIFLILLPLSPEGILTNRATPAEISQSHPLL